MQRHAISIRRRIVTGLLLAGLAGAAHAEIVIEDVWARATPPGFDKGAVYFELTNDSPRSNALVGVSTERAPRAELHRTIEEGGNSRMVHTPRVAIPAESEVIFEPGGRHVMLMGIETALTEGERFTIRLETEDGGELAVEVQVLAPTAMGVD
ncbi:copper chaperone PCu(A)C [Spiribacter vilamensis]|uniref:Copper chaperone PCu(A)C n=1 Tax=Spiribacter vilamensis TaxID=531306 RepID=A0A4Q8D2X9_9GAMM|nr:copper chaperone PCu(A)C [Spiribacter vilamensis]RZU99704.1 hypothetical protein EV698_1999 [Spiribacter vilamensis]TVO61349.1 copper chaperone PCu(A)C [Spiribacter vilamensis]